MADVEKLTRERRRLLLSSMVTYALWCGTLVLLASPGFTPDTRHMLGIWSEVLVLPWGISLLWLVVWQRRVKAQPRAVAALNDEMTVRNRWRAQNASRWVMLVSLMVGVVICSYVEVNARLVLMSLIWLLVISQIGFYLWYDRD